MKNKFNIAVLTSGKSRGSNFEAIAEYIRRNRLPIDIKFLVITRQDSPIRTNARKHSVRELFLPDKNAFEEKLIPELIKDNVHLIVLAGFMRKISADFIRKFSGKIINIHPALLPKYGGRGMYGMRVHQSVFDNDEQYSGATVHYVDELYDEGEIVDQIIINISDCNSPEEIAKKVLVVEHELYPKVIQNFATQYLDSF
ncbi:MAG: phosphoribosylglycinamide formyltransferase [Candidatus Cloacimonadota bacterium]|nr:phosphoribosylglycinamide formyltransferase [Candidatus Cloacimonadota bacterium]